jgi:hypothetical protein
MRRIVNKLPILDTVTFRTSEYRYALTHIVVNSTTIAFCGKHLPTAVLEDQNRVYYNKGNVSCKECLTEFHNGRRNGYRNEPIEGNDNVIRE